MTSSTGLMSLIEYDLSLQCSCIDVSMELLRRTWWTVAHSQQKSLAVNICVLPLSGSWSYRAIDWTVSVVGAFLWRARQLGIWCQTVFVTQNWVSILSNVSWRHIFFAKYWWRNVLSTLEIFLSMCYINIHFTYLLTNRAPDKQFMTTS